MVLGMGPVTAVQPGSPAEKAGFQNGDLITALNGAVIGAAEPGERRWDPITMPYRLSSESGELTFEVQRGEESLTLTVEPEEFGWNYVATGLGAGIALPRVGICYGVTPEVISLVEGSPAAKHFRVGDRMTSFQLLPPEGKKEPKMKVAVEVSEENQNWPHFIYLLQEWPLDGRVRLTAQRKQEQIDAAIRA